MTRPTAIVIACASLLACGDATSTDGLDEIPIGLMAQSCDNQQVFSQLKLYGPPGSTIMRPLPGKWVVRGNYDLTQVTISGVVATLDDVDISLGFWGQFALDEDASHPFVVTKDKLIGAFEASTVLGSYTSQLTPIVWAETDPDVYLSCVQFY